MTETERTQKIFALLDQHYPDVTTQLTHESPFELLVATVMSAQTTDSQVNKVTPALFQRYPTPEALALASPEDVAAHIRSIGFWQTKAKNLVALAKILADRHRGQVPAQREALEALPGVGRKTASVVLATAFGIPAIAVDTHVFRVAKRLGFSKGKTPEAVEKDLMARIPEKRWALAHHQLIWHGRKICKAQRPLCHHCPIAAYCLYYQLQQSGIGGAPSPLLETGQKGE